MDAVIDTQAAEEPGPGRGEIIDFEAYRRARGLAPRRIDQDADPYPWAYTFGPQRPAG